jgi:hypothetical protein
MRSNFEAHLAANAVARHPDPRAAAARRTLVRAAGDPQKSAEVKDIFFGRSRPGSTCVRGSNNPACKNANIDAVIEGVIQARIGPLLELSREKATGPHLQNAESVEAINVLASAGRVHEFDELPLRNPLAHDTLMRELATSVGPVFETAIFEDILLFTHDDLAAPFQLNIYLDGRRYRTMAIDYGGFLDIDAVLRLMNAVLAEKESPVRFVPLLGNGRMARIIAASPERVNEAARAGLIRLEDPTKAKQLRVERLRVLKKLRESRDPEGE